LAKVKDAKLHTAIRVKNVFSLPKVTKKYEDVNFTLESCWYVVAIHQQQERK
jgi:hypothetical protein